MRLRAAWLTEENPSFGRKLVLAPLTLLSWLYAAGAWFHRFLYRRRWRRAKRLGCRVISLGSVVAGGAAKTPAAAWIATALHRRGHKVAIASRGHGRRGRERVVVVSDGRFVRASVSQAGDEPALLAARAPGVPVLVGRDRSVVGLRAVSAFGADVLVLDDGFQHHRLDRDLEVVMLDAKLGLGNRRTLPRGPLREPASALRLADVIGVVGGSLPERDQEFVARVAPQARMVAMQRRPLGIRPLRGGSLVGFEKLVGTPLGMLAGIAQPAGFRRSLQELGAEVVAERIFPDHHAYDAPDLANLGDKTHTWVTTEKDAVKILPSWLPPNVELWVLVIELAVEDERGFLDWVEAKLRAPRAV